MLAGGDDGHLTFINSDLRWANFNYADFIDIDGPGLFTNSNLSNTSFRHAIFDSWGTGTILTGADFQFATFAGGDFAGIDFTGAYVFGTDFTGATNVDLTGAILTPFQVPEPSTLALLCIGLFGMGLARRRKKI